MGIIKMMTRETFYRRMAGVLLYLSVFTLVAGLTLAEVLERLTNPNGWLMGLAYAALSLVLYRLSVMNMNRAEEKRLRVMANEVSQR